MRIILHEIVRNIKQKKAVRKAVWKGRLKPSRRVICKYLARRFGADSASVQEKVPQLTDMDVLDRVLEQLFAANTLEEARNIIWEELSQSSY
ncbi:hypothetical protein Desku_2080 [Desulfofundulus kuznetsovii DSM 6115]|uniref:Uncharacterized protein n=1 Tax=Desulfofundulus kuznetsovii (strain DSM 6115 / VKM B-1805 / 17) TaxID=760568 RepID=A0AAU8PC34_DESK7|nr:hypothetical protein Desku_2080 [Desulfofundulus kuznetsovii DSM 6115]